MNRRVMGAAVLLAVAVWAVLPIARTAAFQGPTRTVPARSAPARQPAATPPGRSQPAAAPVQRSAARPESSSPAERTVAATRSFVDLIDSRVLASDVPGIVDEVPFQEGDAVESDAVVVKIRDDVPAAALATAEKLAASTVEERYAEAAYLVAEKTHEAARQANLTTPNAVPRIEVERLGLDATRAELQIEKAQHDLEVATLRADEAEAQLKAYTITAPFEGVVTLVHKHPGEAVRQGDPILELVSTRRVRVEGWVDIQDFWDIKRGNLVHVQIDLSPESYAAGPPADPRLPDSRAAAAEPARPPARQHEIENRVFEGRLIFVDRTVHRVTRLVRVWAEVDNPDDLLRGGLQAKMTIFPDRMVKTDPPTE